MRYKLIVASALLLSACGERAKIETPPLDTPPLTTTAPTVFTVTNLPPPLTEITEAAEVTTPASAQRADFQEQITTPPSPPFDPVAYVNGLEYRALVMDSAMEAYRVVATYYGWSAATIEARSTFVFRVMANESAGCWNARRLTYFTAGKLCTEHHTGVHDDVGFGQITNVLRPLTCEKAGICSIADTVKSPWNSMLAFVVVLDELGKRPWCYNRNMHVRNGDCGTWPG